MKKKAESGNSEFDHYFSEKPAGKYKARKIMAYVRGKSYFFETATGVFSYKHLDKGTEILLKYLDFPSEGNILDLGAGYGPIGVIVAKELEDINKHTIYFSEINKRAIWVLKKNIRNHGIKNYKLVSGDFVEKAKQLKEQNIRFKAIYSNPPNRLGLDLVFKMLHAAIDLMDEDGFMQYVIKKSYGAESFARRIQVEFPEQEIYCTAIKSGYRIYTITYKGKFETLFPNIVNINVDEDDSDEELNEEQDTEDSEDNLEGSESESDRRFNELYSKEYPEPDKEIVDKFTYEDNVVHSDDSEDDTDSDEDMFSKFNNHQYRESNRSKRKLKRKKRIRMEKGEGLDSDEDLDELFFQEGVSDGDFDEDFDDEDIDVEEIDIDDLYDDDTVEDEEKEQGKHDTDEEDRKLDKLFAGKKKISFGSPFKFNLDDL